MHSVSVWHDKWEEKNIDVRIKISKCRVKRIMHIISQEILSMTVVYTEPARGYVAA